MKKYNWMDFFDFGVTELQWHSNRFHQIHSALSSFCTWIERMYDEQYPNFRNLLPYIEKPDKHPVREKSVFSKAELDKLMDYLDKQGRIQEKCLLALMMASGARMSELCRFKTSIIDESNTAFEGLFLETTEKVKVKGRGVDGKHINMYIIKDLFLPYYKKWLAIRAEQMKNACQNHDYVFITKDGKPASVSTFKSWFERWNKFTYNEFNKNWYGHSQRHFNTTYLLSVGVGKELVQTLKDWQSDVLVSVYDDSTAKDRKWKGLDKLKVALEQDKINQPLSNKNST